MPGSCLTDHTGLVLFNMFIDFREQEEGGERDREGEKKINVREKHRLVAFHTDPDWGSNPQPRYVP